MTSSFRAPAWAWLVTACAVALFVLLAAWQTQRGLAKQRMIGQLAAQGAAAETLSAAAPAPEGLHLARAQASGTYVVDRQLLEDGQSHREQPGYHVWTPLLLTDGAIALVDRGWIPRDAAAHVEAPPAGAVSVSGFWRALPEPGLRLAGTANCPAAAKFPAIVLYPTHAELQCLLGSKALAGLLLLDAEQPGGFVRAWSDFGFPPERHFGYAFQWALLALASLVIFYVVNRKSVP